MQKPNIILITTDQQRFDTIQALGNNSIFTPHLNWLTDEGITFTRCYADCPVCIPSRTTIMSGMRGYSSGIVGNSNHYDLLSQNPTLPGILTQNGYQTRAIGKMHFEPCRAHYGFEHTEITVDYHRQCKKNLDKVYPKGHGNGENEIDPVISTVDEVNSLTHWTVERSIDFLETRDETRPFFLWTGFSKPHPPFDPCFNYWNLYETDDMPDPVYGDWSEDLDDIPHGFYKNTYMLNNIQRYSKKQVKAIRRAYYACITQIDYSLGLMFSRIRELGLLDNTWIIFTSDHGDMLGDHHMGAKFIFLEGASHVPMIIRPPYKPFTKLNDDMGSRCDTLVEMADIFPTIMEIANINPGIDMEGKSLLSLNKKSEDRIYYGNCGNNTFAVMDGYIKYTYTVYGGQELMFNLENDPYEQIDLASKVEHKQLLDKMRNLLLDKIKTHNPNLIENGQIKKEKAITGTKDVPKWPGFHSITFEKADVLH